MEWMKAIGDSIQYIEAHICEEIFMDDLARHIGISPYYYQKGFAMLCDFTVAEYIRNRRLALAGRDVVCTDRKIIDIALQMATILRTASRRRSPVFTVQHRLPSAGTAPR